MGDMKVRLTFSRHESARFISHLDAMNHLLRAVRRSGLPYQVTQGCHPRPKTSFGPPVALGFASRCEVMDLTLRESVPVEEAANLVRQQLPIGFGLVSAVAVEPGMPPLTAEAETEFRLEFAPDAAELRETARRFFLDPETRIRAGKPGQEREVILAGAVSEARLVDGPPLALHLIFAAPAKGIPSGAKIIQAFLAGLGDRRPQITLIERVRISAAVAVRQVSPNHSQTQQEVTSEFAKNSGDGGPV
ncbi:MAG TPA: TIGR03936 family radical SAM-associated protein [Candidatus Ozemobacteraceae bacterium]|nr:TIGR03936 family radical SAM-associated protein [Candidatus Ozemobacteraceae bacterium]